MSTLAIVLIAIGVIVVLGLIYLATRKRREQQLEDRRMVAAEHREEADARRRTADTEAAAAEEQAAAARRQAAEAQQRAEAAQEERAAATAHVEHAREIDPDPVEDSSEDDEYRTDGSTTDSPPADRRQV